MYIFKIWDASGFWGGAALLGGETGRFRRGSSERALPSATHTPGQRKCEARPEGVFGSVEQSRGAPVCTRREMWREKQRENRRENRVKTA